MQNGELYKLLTTLQLQNFKCFGDHIIPLRPVTIIVGRNNAGKSTIIEALRLISIAVGHYKSINYSDAPAWLDDIPTYRGISPSLKGMEFNFDESVFHRYGDPPSTIIATFETKETIKIHIGPDSKIHAEIINSKGMPIQSKGQANLLNLPTVSILPQIAPLARKEIVLTEEYIRKAMSSYLAPLHFRNHLNLWYGSFKEFKEISESTWSGLRIRSLESRNKMPGSELSLLVQDHDFVAEVGWMGHGLQMWLQTMWFLTRSKNHDTVILDEPDVYMHADLQRKLIRFMQGRHQQIIIATHSIEIMAEVEPDQVLVVDRKKKQSTFTTSLPAVQRVIDHIGGIHNIQLARLWSSRRFLLVEGKDIKILKHFQNTLFRESEESFDAIPNMPIGGWGGWNYAVGSSLFLKNAGGENIITYCILDSDYHTEEEINERINEAKNRGVQLHIWVRKEIENYLLVPTAIHRVILSGIKENIKPPTISEITIKIGNIVNSLKDETFDAIATELLAKNRAGGASAANKAAREQIKKAWKTQEGKLSIVSGKKVLSILFKWSQEKFNVSLNKDRIAKVLRPDEITPEIVTIVESIEKTQNFNGGLRNTFKKI